LYDREAPWTIRAGGVGTVIYGLLRFVQTINVTRSSDGGSAALWGGVLLPILFLFWSLFWAWLLVNLIGLFYWITIAIGVPLFLGRIVLSAVAIFEGKSAWGDPAGFGWLLTPDALLSCVIVGLLLARPSYKAMWRRSQEVASAP
jgi:hypothetical protein